MSYKKTLLLTLSLSFPLCANFFKGITDFMNDTNYAWVTTAGLLTAGGIYTYYKTKEYNAHKERFNHHELLQDHYDHMLNIKAAYNYPSNPLSLCIQLGHKTQYQLSRLQAQATHDLNQLISDHKAALKLFHDIKNDKRYALLYRQKELFIEQYNELLPKLRQLIRQIPYIKAQNFLDNNKVLLQELALKDLSTYSFMNTLNDIIHSRSHGSKKYPYRSYNEWLSNIRPTVTSLAYNLRGFQSEPFQQEVVTAITNLDEVLSLIALRIKGSSQYKKECRLYEEECRRKAEEERRRAEALAKAVQKAAEEVRRAEEETRRLEFEQQKLDELKKQTKLMKEQAEKDKRSTYVSPPPSAPPLENNDFYTSVPSYNPDSVGTVPSAPPLENNDLYSAPPSYNPHANTEASAPPLEDATKTHDNPYASQQTYNYDDTDTAPSAPPLESFESPQKNTPEERTDYGDSLKSKL